MPKVGKSTRMPYTKAGKRVAASQKANNKAAKSRKKYS
tara:strand:- start:449 stop:562 length:114 start_codon:yes stop_codon:yes gene_type:complete